jgi:membrane-bound lytic murein transglycosylase A
MRFWIPAALALALGLTGCVTTHHGPRSRIVSGPAWVPPPPPPSAPPSQLSTTTPSQSPASPPSTSPFDSLTGWAQDDHAAALTAFAAGCEAGRDAAEARVCRMARTDGPFDEAAARTFFEKNFRPEPLSEPGLLTAYYTPIYEARDHQGGEFTAAVRPRPADLPRTRPSEGAPPSYADRSLIECRPAHNALAWMRPEDLFFLQIQGSGVLAFQDGSRLRAVFDGSNGAPFLGLAAPMRHAGLLPDADTSGETIHAWLAANRGRAAEALMRLDRRYVFFRLEPDDGIEPSGAAGRRLIPGRALAVDATRHGMGELLWVDATAPALSGAFPTYRRLALALDTGGAIKGDVRADLYLGMGPAAGLEAGRVRHVLKLYRLAPIADAGS